MDSTPIQPVISWPGAKWMLARKIVKFLPEHQVYGEPFFGSGAVFFLKERAHIEILNDQDDEVTHLFQMIRDRTEELAWAVTMTPYAREEHRHVRHAAPVDEPVERARRFLVRCSMSYGGQPSAKGWNPPARRHEGTRDDWRSRTATWAALPARFQRAAERLRDAHIECGPALAIINRYDEPEVLLYCDPPYLMDTRQSQEETYTHEMTEADHRALLDRLLAFRGMVLISGYMSDLYRTRLKGWRCLRFLAHAVDNTYREEFLWCNPAASRHWSESIGRR